MWRWLRKRPIAGPCHGAAVERRGAGRVGGGGRRGREGGVTLSANQLQAHGCFRVGRVECAVVAGAQAAAGRRIVGSGADVAWGVAGQGAAVLERGVPLSAWRVARSVYVSGCLRRWAQPYRLCAAGGRAGRGGARRGHATQRGSVGGDFAHQSRAAEAAGVGVMAGGRHRVRGGRRGREHGRGDPGGGSGR